LKSSFRRLGLISPSSRAILLGEEIEQISVNIIQDIHPAA
jgi:hypothetical protein